MKDSPRYDESKYKKLLFKRLRSASGLYPFAMSGKALTDIIKKTVDQYGQQASAPGLVR